MNIKEQKILSPNFLPGLLGSFAKPAAENPTVAIMEAAFRHHQLHYRYINCEVGPENLYAAVEGAKAMGWRGFNCSIPNKVKVMKYLDRIGESAQIIGAVNTVVIAPDGRTTGENTDGKGFVKAISEVTSIPGKKAVIFGAGGAARAIAVEMALAGVGEIIIVNVSERGKSLSDLLNSRTPAKASFLPWNRPFSIPSDADIVINATIMGMKPHEDLSPITDKSVFRSDLIVCDVVYNPEETRLLREAKEAGCAKTIGGKGMLLWQGVAAYKLYTGLDMPVEEYKKYQAENAK